MQVSVSSTLTLYHDGQFWVGLIEHVEDGAYGVARVVFGAEPSDEEVLQFVVRGWEKLSFFEGETESGETYLTSKLAKNPKRRQREAAQALSQPALSTKAQQALAEQREARKTTSAQTHKLQREAEKLYRFQQRTEKHKQKHRGH
jgi:hypothetical protein